MCTALAFSAHGGGIAATCRRWTVTYTNGANERLDLGGKLRKTATGWTVATGQILMVLSGLRLLEEITEPEWVTDPDIGRKRIRELHDRRSNLIRSLSSSADPGKAAFLSLHVVSGESGVEHVSPSVDDGVPFEVASRVLLSWPPVATENPDVLRPLLQINDHPVKVGELLAAATSKTDLIRRIARIFAFTAELDESSGPNIDLGILESSLSGVPSWYQLTGVAAELAEASDLELLRGLRQPPDVPPFPELPAEVLAFEDLFPGVPAAEFYPRPPGDR